MKQDQNKKLNTTNVLIALAVLNFIIGVVAIVMHFRVPTNIVYVDALKLVGKYKGMEDAKASLNAKSKVWETNLDTLRNEFERTLKGYEANRKTSSVREKELSEELLKTKQQQYLNYEQTVKDQYQKEDKELSKKILDKVNDYIKRYGQSNGYVIILAATQYGNIAYAENGLDITDKVLEGLNKEYKKND